MKDIAAGIVLAALSAGYYWIAAEMPTSILDTAVNSAAFPKLLGVAGGALSLLLIGQALARRLRVVDTPAEMEEQNWRPHLRALGLLGIVCLFILALEVIGYPMAVGALILAVSVYHGYPLSRLSVAVAVGGGLGFWLFFMVLLGIHLPLGLWSHLGLGHL
jgi:hypothetical protein